MSYPSNIYQQVALYNESDLVLFQNSNVFLNKSNKMFQNFQNFSGQKGSTVTFRKPTKYTVTDSLVIQFQATVDELLTLTVDQEASVGFANTVQNYVYNAKDYMDAYGRSAVVQLGAKVETNLARNCETAPYRFYGNGTTQISTPNDLANAVALFKNVGYAPSNIEGVLSDVAIPNIANAGLAQFAPDRNNKLANTWELAPFAGCSWYSSNLLPTHLSGTEGTASSTLTVVSTVTNSEGGVTSITFSGTNGASDANSIKLHDRFQFFDGVTGFTNLRFLTQTGYIPSSAPVQFRSTVNAASTGASQVTVDIFPALQATAGIHQNINTPIVPGMQVFVLPSHRAGVIWSNSPLYLGMPQLPDQFPYPTGNKVDEKTGASIRHTYGSIVFQNQIGTSYDCLWGSVMDPDRTMAVIFPL